ncbi:hypothetical protein IFM12275_25250 [Nocardia sputorum]|uniref:Uncharacterized protein n=1 Tax=Nocardia sputorum TaxID=2984338 RepID=A0ABM8D1D8_9NOCA|nr:hypothetical protein IFM12275_25250 [Nocardia sputorum]BDU01118.1 hypothetical protein IFM12276_41460 [Nocardia sputorum]
MLALPRGRATGYDDRRSRPRLAYAYVRRRADPVDGTTGFPDCSCSGRRTRVRDESPQSPHGTLVERRENFAWRAYER